MAYFSPLTSTAGLGYFAFLPQNTTISPTLEQLPINDIPDDQIESEEDHSWKAQQEIEAEARQRRRDREAEEARRGEEEWVRSGGTLRDVEGRRDMIRTNAVREELRLREVERGLMERWKNYEIRWNDLVRKIKEEGIRIEITFRDIPWPVEVETELNLACFTTEKVREFLLADLQVRSSTVTKKERVRSSLLRWHPDKMTSVLSRVVQDDMELVKQGVNMVMMCLQRLNYEVGVA